MQSYINWLKIERLKALERDSQNVPQKRRETTQKFSHHLFVEIKNKKIAPPSYHEENEWGHL